MFSKSRALTMTCKAKFTNTIQDLTIVLESLNRSYEERIMKEGHVTTTAKS